MTVIRKEIDHDMHIAEMQAAPAPPATTPSHITDEKIVPKLLLFAGRAEDYFALEADAKMTLGCSGLHKYE